MSSIGGLGYPIVLSDFRVTTNNAPMLKLMTIQSVGPAAGVW